MSSFILLQIKVKDPIKLKEYTDPAPATVAPFGGELIFRGNVSGIEWGKSWHSCAVVINFQIKNHLLDGMLPKGIRTWLKHETKQQML